MKKLIQPESSTSSENTVQTLDPGNDSNSKTGASPVDFPKSYKEGILYTTVTRGSTFEELYTSKEAIQAVKNDEPIPIGTVITLLIYRDDVLSQYFVMEKRANGGSHYPDELRNGEWEYQAFAADGTLDNDEDINNCLSCHANQGRNDFVNTLEEMKEYNVDNSSASYSSGSTSEMGKWDVNVISASQDSTNNDKSKFDNVHGSDYQLGAEETKKKMKELLLTIYLQQVN
jgi:hypothetical protein